ncbi:MAG: thiamine pyrophosphate-binding protein [Egibacteraceae bacterium]
MTERTGRFAIIEQLLADGIRYMFGNPGTSEEGFLDALLDYPDLDYILALQETVAVAMADGYARATREPTIVQLHSGVGLGNGIGMMYQAKRGHSPLVVIAGESGLRYDAMDAQMACDLVALAEPVTKWATRVVDPSSTLRVLRRAIKMAATPPTAPVFVALPMDVLDAVCDEDIVPTSRLVTRSAPSAEDVARAADLLVGSQLPLILMGDGVAFSGAQEELTRVAELLGAEVWGADSSEVNIDATHPCFQGLTGHMFGSYSQPIISRADAVLICGTYPLPEVFPSLAHVFAPSAKVVHIDLDAYEIAKNFPVDLGLVADPKMTLARLAGAIHDRQSPAQATAAAQRVGQMGEAKAHALSERRALDERARDQLPLHLSRFTSELASHLPDDAIVFDDTITNSPQLIRYLPPRTPGTYFSNRGGSLGVGIPGALGIKLARPSHEVWALTGDGGAMYTPQALWTAAHYHIDAKFVICHNHSYEILKENLEQYWRERNLPDRPFPESFDLREPDIKFAELAQSLGIQAVRVEKPHEVSPAIEQARSHPGPFLIDLMIENE